MVWQIGPNQLAFSNSQNLLEDIDNSWHMICHDENKSPTVLPQIQSLVSSTCKLGEVSAPCPLDMLTSSQREKFNQADAVTLQLQDQLIFWLNQVIEFSAKFEGQRTKWRPESRAMRLRTPTGLLCSPGSYASFLQEGRCHMFWITHVTNKKLFLTFLMLLQLEYLLVHIGILVFCQSVYSW